MRRAEVSPAFLGSLALHGLVIAAIIWSWSLTRNLTIGSAVPVTIVTSGPPDADLRAAEQAPQQQAAQTETPQPQAPPQPTPPAPQPKPAPIPPTPAPTPQKPQPVAKAAPQKPQPPAKPKPEKTLDLDALAASLAKQVPKPTNAAKGPNRAETALEARQTNGSGHSALAMTGLERELQRRWNPNCDVQGGRDVQVKVVFQLGSGGQVVGQVTSQIMAGGRGPVAQAAADRAVRAVYAAAPFRDLPPDFYGERIAVNFNARNACS